MIVEERIRTINELKKEIAEKTAQLKAMQRGSHFVFTDYNDFCNGKYKGHSLGHYICGELRTLCYRLLSLEEHRRPDKTYYLDGEKLKNHRQLTSKEILICNNMLKELCPIIQKYAKQILDIKQRNKEA